MAVHNNGGVFVVKDRLEALEARIETALDEAGLKDFTKQVARDAIGDIVNDIVEELRAKKDDVINQVAVERLEVDSRLKETQGNFDVAIAEHVVRIYKSMERIGKLVKLSLLASLVSLVLSLFM
jgi:tetrahydromethanopterin S-methyltransferase subunit G